MHVGVEWDFRRHGVLASDSRNFVLCVYQYFHPRLRPVTTDAGEGSASLSGEDSSSFDSEGEDAVPVVQAAAQDFKYLEEKYGAMSEYAEPEEKDIAIRVKALKKKKKELEREKRATKEKKKQTVTLEKSLAPRSNEGGTCSSASQQHGLQYVWHCYMDSVKNVMTVRLGMQTTAQDASTKREKRVSNINTAPPMILTLLFPTRF